MQLEGRRTVIEALRAGRPLRKILLADSVRGSPEIAELTSLASRRGVKVDRVPMREIDQRAQGPAPQGVIALAPPLRYADLDEPLALAEQRGERALLVALDGVTDPRNVGAVARTAEAAGAHGLVLPERRSADVTPIVEKTAAGALAHLPVVKVGNLSNALETLRRRGVWIVALDATASTAVWDLNLADEPLCLVVGAEGRGVSRLVLDRSDAAVRIPMHGRVSSLNVSVAAGVALFEIVRLRTG